MVAEPSLEIENVLRDTLAAMTRSDVEATGRRISKDACVIAIGSDPAEWAEGYDDVMRVWKDSTPEGKLGVKVGLDDVKAFSEGGVGWDAGHGYFELGGKRVAV